MFKLSTQPLSFSLESILDFDKIFTKTCPTNQLFSDVYPIP